MGLNADAGSLAAAVMAGWAGSTVFWFGVGSVIWKLFFLPRIKALEGQLEAERSRCDKEIAALRDRVNELETVLLIKPPRRKATTVGAKPRGN